jgi:hypothetical protein
MEDSAETDSRGRYKAAFDDVVMTRVLSVATNQMRSGINV